jgi:aconitate hydratase
LKPNQDITIRLSSGKTLTVRCRLNTEVEIAYFKNGGILPYVLRKKI